MNYTPEEIENLCVLLHSTKIDVQIARNYIYDVLHLEFSAFEALNEALHLPELDRIGIDKLYQQLYIFDGDDDYEYYPIPYKCGIDEQLNYDYIRLEYMQNYYPKYIDDSHLASWHQILPALKRKKLWIEDGLYFSLMIVEPDFVPFFLFQRNDGIWETPCYQ